MRHHGWWRGVAAAGILAATVPAAPAQSRAGTKSPDAFGRSMAQRLKGSRIDVSWEEATLEEVLRDVTVMTGIHFVITRDLEDLASDGISLNLRRMRALDVLRLVEGMLDMQFIVEPEYLLATTREDAVRRRAFLRVYDLRPVTFAPTSFPAPVVFGLRPSGVEPPEPPEVETAEGLDPGEVMDLLRNATGGAEWEYDSVSMDTMGHLLVVKHTPEMHRKVSRYLRLLSAF